jgi:hypothetical protein
LLSGTGSREAAWVACADITVHYQASDTGKEGNLQKKLSEFSKSENQETLERSSSAPELNRDRGKGDFRRGELPSHPKAKTGPVPLPHSQPPTAGVRAPGHQRCNNSQLYRNRGEFPPLAMI